MVVVALVTPPACGALGCDADDGRHSFEEEDEDEDATQTHRRIKSLLDF